MIVRLISHQISCHQYPIFFSHRSEHKYTISSKLAHFSPLLPRLFYQNSDTDERGIEYDRLIELPECNVRSGGGRLPTPQLILNERERHLISNRLYSEYADDQDRFNRLADEEVCKNIV